MKAAHRRRHSAQITLRAARSRWLRSASPVVIGAQPCSPRLPRSRACVVTVSCRTEDDGAETQRQRQRRASRGRGEWTPKAAGSRRVQGGVCRCQPTCLLLLRTTSAVAACSRRTSPLDLLLLLSHMQPRVGPFAARRRYAPAMGGNERTEGQKTEA